MPLTHVYPCALCVGVLVYVSVDDSPGPQSRPWLRKEMHGSSYSKNKKTSRLTESTQGHFTDGQSEAQRHK